ncbi:vam6/Vps39-like protein [Battus philenor]|uniref:vam6/Vps39-like protein n=1 Tax=Battus philenor TaxID=42288 RepID=UPI0035CFEB3A
MHEAYEVSHLLNATVQIESIAAYDGNLLLGTRQGHLLMYSLSAINGNQKYELQLLRYCKNFSKKPIQQIEVVPEDNLLLCLSDNLLSTYDINGVNFPLIKSFPQTKGASLFALDNKSATSMTGESNSVVHLCVAVRRKLQVYYGKNGEFKQHIFDYTVPDVPKVLAWGQEYLCVGFKAEYTLFDLSSGKPKELFPTSSSRSLEPTIARYSETSFLLGRDNTSVLVEEAKDIEIKKTIKWTEAPVAIVWDKPFILGLLSDQVIVQTVEPPMFIQTLPELNKARLMYRCKRGLIFVASVGQVWCLSSIDVTKQRQQLLKDKQFQIAIDLTLLSDCTPEEKKQTLHSIRMLSALDLFDDKKYSQSMQVFKQLNTDPADVIKLFPELDNKPGNEQHEKMKTKDLENALNALIDYLVDVRANIGKAITEEGGSKDDGISHRNVTQQLELIDTTLLKCYLQTNDAFVAPLLRLNNCRLEEAEKTLSQHGKHSELIILYQTKGQHTKALQLLKEQAKQPDSSLKGYHRTKNYLQHLGADHINLIFKFSDWILEEHPEEGLKIFTEDIVEVENLPRPKVLDFLLREHKSLVTAYLEHVIYTWNDTNPIFHDALVSMYREKITEHANKSGTTTTTDEEIQHIKSKLLTFLEKSTHYTPERVILHFPTDSMFEERAVILGKLGRHEQALAIYVLILGDVDRAIRYCEQVCESSSNKTPDVYVILMRILMNPEQSGALSGPLANVARHPNSSVPDIETALTMLEKHADKISPLKALSVLPDSVPLSRLKHFLENALERQLTKKRKVQVLKGLLYAEHLQVKEVKEYHESKSIVIHDYNVCSVCKKRFGNQSAFVRHPNGDIVHFSCSLDKQ